MSAVLLRGSRWGQIRLKLRKNKVVNLKKEKEECFEMVLNLKLYILNLKKYRKLDTKIVDLKLKLKKL